MYKGAGKKKEEEKKKKYLAEHSAKKLYTNIF